MSHMTHLNIFSIKLITDSVTLKAMVRYYSGKKKCAINPQYISVHQSSIFLSKFPLSDWESTPIFFGFVCQKVNHILAVAAIRKRGQLIQTIIRVLHPNHITLHYTIHTLFSIHTSL